jgi:hypothetical protein
MTHRRRGLPPFCVWPLRLCLVAIHSIEERGARKSPSTMIITSRIWELVSAIW